MAGRLQHTAERLRLEDASGSVELVGLDGEQTGNGDCVSGRLLAFSANRFRLDEAVVHAPRLAESPDPELPGRLSRLALRADALTAHRVEPDRVG